jgi:hypothetical protein
MTTVVNKNSYAIFNGKPTDRARHVMQVEFILDEVYGAFHQPDDMMNWIASNPYVTSVTFAEKEED